MFEEMKPHTVNRELNEMKCQRNTEIEQYKMHPKVKLTQKKRVKSEEKRPQQKRM